MRKVLAGWVWVALLQGAGPALAFEVVDTDQAAVTMPGMTRAFVDPALQVLPQIESDSAVGVQSGQSLRAFKGRYKGDWTIRWDRRSDRPNLIQGSGVPLLPGHAGADASTSAQASTVPVELDAVVAAVEGFRKEVEPLLRLDGIDLRLDRQRSASFGADPDRWFVNLAQYHQGLPVRGAYAYFRIVHGNVVQFGTQRVAEVDIDVTPAQPREDAWRSALGQLQLAPGASVAEIVEPGELLLLPSAPPAGADRGSYRGPSGRGYAHRLAWRFVYRLAGILATYEMLFDAHTGRIIEVRDLNAYADATVEGGVFLSTNTEPEVSVPLP